MFLDTARGYPFSVQEQLLGRLEAGRFPELVFKGKKNYWYWGMENDIGVFYPEENPYVKFTECAARRKIANFPEYEVFEVDPAQITHCLHGNQIARN